MSAQQALFREDSGLLGRGKVLMHIGLSGRQKAILVLRLQFCLLVEFDVWGPLIISADHISVFTLGPGSLLLTIQSLLDLKLWVAMLK